MERSLSPGQRRKDDLLHLPARFTVHDCSGDEPTLDQDSVDAFVAPTLLLEGLFELPLRDVTPAHERRADPVVFPGRTGGLKLPLVEEELPHLIASDDRERAGKPVALEAPQDHDERRSGERAGNGSDGAALFSFSAQAVSAVVSSGDRGERGRRILPIITVFP